MRTNPAGGIDVFRVRFSGLSARNSRAPTTDHPHPAALHRRGVAASRPLTPVAEGTGLQRGDGSWDTCKTLLGWDVDTVRRTVALPKH
jgi:hypothetical protein